MTEQQAESEQTHLDIQEQIEEYLSTFSQFVEASDDQKNLSLEYNDPWLWHYDGEELDFHLVVSVMIHGNEVGPLEGLIDVMDALDSGKLKYKGKLSFFIGNPEAARLNKRFVDLDLNRVFEPSLIKESIAQSSEFGTLIPYEIERASQLLPLLDQADLYIDFHQTIIDSAQPFYICPFSQQTWEWMRIMGGAKVWVTRHPNSEGGGLHCADAYVRELKKPSIALELGEAGFSTKARSGVWKSLNRALTAINHLGGSSQEQAQSLSDLASTEHDLQFYETSYRCRFQDPMFCLKEGYVNFQTVVENEELSSLNTPSLHAPKSGALLFPKYPQRDESGKAIEPRASELYRIISPLQAHPTELWPDLFE